MSHSLSLIPPALRRLVAFGLICSALTFAAWTPQAQAALSAADLADVARAESYLNQITTLQARFLQVAPSGETSEGDVFLSRPGHLRLTYDPPSPIQVIANGDSLIYYDTKLKQVTYLDLDSSAAGVLVRTKVELNGKDLQTTHVGHQPGVLQLTLVQPKDRRAGDLTLVFSDNPLTLRQWKVVDGQGNLTTVSLFETRSGVTLDPKMFEFVDPSFSKTGEGQR